MKTFNPLLFFFLLPLAFLSCDGTKGGSGTDSDSIWTRPEDVTADIMQLDSRTFTDTITAYGRLYTYTYHFEPDDSLPTIVNADGQRYRDNRVQLVITAPDGSTLLDRTFTKKSFLSTLDGVDPSSSALVGFNYNLNKLEDHSGLYFIATVGDPDPTAELTSSVELTISSSGAISLSRATGLETDPLGPGLFIDPERNPEE